MEWRQQESGPLALLSGRDQFFLRRVSRFARAADCQAACLRSAGGTWRPDDPAWAYCEAALRASQYDEASLGACIFGHAGPPAGEASPGAAMAPGSLGTLSEASPKRSGPAAAHASASSRPAGCRALPGSVRKGVQIPGLVRTRQDSSGLARTRQATRASWICASREPQNRPKIRQKNSRALRAQRFGGDRRNLRQHFQELLGYFALHREEIANFRDIIKPFTQRDHDFTRILP